MDFLKTIIILVCLLVVCLEAFYYEMPKELAGNGIIDREMRSRPPPIPDLFRGNLFNIPGIKPNQVYEVTDRNYVMSTPEMLKYLSYPKALPFPYMSSFMPVRDQTIIGVESYQKDDEPAEIIPYVIKKRTTRSAPHHKGKSNEDIHNFEKFLNNLKNFAVDSELEFDDPKDKAFETFANDEDDENHAEDNLKKRTDESMRDIEAETDFYDAPKTKSYRDLTGEDFNSGFDFGGDMNPNLRDDVDQGEDRDDNPHSHRHRSREGTSFHRLTENFKPIGNPEVHQYSTNIKHDQPRITNDDDVYDENDNDKRNYQGHYQPRQEMFDEPEDRYRTPRQDFNNDERNYRHHQTTKPKPYNEVVVNENGFVNDDRREHHHHPTEVPKLFNDPIEFYNTPVSLFPKANGFEDPRRDYDFAKLYDTPGGFDFGRDSYEDERDRFHKEEQNAYNDDASYEKATTQNPLLDEGYESRNREIDRLIEDDSSERDYLSNADVVDHMKRSAQKYVNAGHESNEPGIKSSKDDLDEVKKLEFLIGKVGVHNRGSGGNGGGGIGAPAGAYFPDEESETRKRGFFRPAAANRRPKTHDPFSHPSY